MSLRWVHVLVCLFCHVQSQINSIGQETNPHHSEYLKSRLQREPGEMPKHKAAPGKVPTIIDSLSSHLISVP